MAQCKYILPSAFRSEYEFLYCRLDEGHSGPHDSIHGPDDPKRWILKRDYYCRMCGRSAGDDDDE